MKNIAYTLLSILLLSFGCKTSKPLTENNPVPMMTQPIRTETNFSEQSNWLLGYFSKERLSSPPHSEWYQNGFDEYQANNEAISKLTGISKEDLTIKIIMGTWCPDSRREVPRFMRILDTWEFPSEKVTFIGVDNAKLSPVGEYNDLDIQRVPTFILYKNNIEAGRIIENPVTSLEQDMVNILTKE